MHIEVGDTLILFGPVVENLVQGLPSNRIPPRQGLIAKAKNDVVLADPHIEIGSERRDSVIQRGVAQITFQSIFNDAG